MKVTTPQGIATATLIACHPSHEPNPITGAAMRETWRLTLSVGSLEISEDKLALDPSTMGEDYLRQWANIQTAEGYAANVAECDRLIQMCKRG